MRTISDISLPLFADEPLFLGKDLLPWLLLAFGGALVVGNVAAWLRPPPRPDDDLSDPDLSDDVGWERPSRSRTLVMVAVGALAALWALASLLAK